jgi:RNA polymerase sigma-70 factor (ECF subfamily)
MAVRLEPAKKKPKLTDELILARAKRLRKAAGNTAVGEILGRYLQDARYLHVAMGILHRHEDAEDAVSEAVVLALRKWRQFRGESKFSTWFTRIVITCSLMARRGKNGNGADHTNDIPERWMPQNLDDDIYQGEISALLREAVNKLEVPRERAVLQMRVVEGLTFREISKRISTPLGSTKNIALGAYQKLKDKLMTGSEHQNTEE